MRYRGKINGQIMVSTEENKKPRIAMASSTDMGGGPAWRGGEETRVSRPRGKEMRPKSSSCSEK